MRLSSFFSVVVLVLAATAVAPAAAQDQDAAARRAFRLGQANYENGEFAEAARYFEEAYRLSGRPRLLFNAFVAYRDMQDLRNAARTLRTFLDETTDLPAAERDQLLLRLQVMERNLPPETPETTGTGTGDPPDTTDGGTTDGGTTDGGTTDGGTTDGGTTDGTDPGVGTGGTDPGGAEDGGGFNPAPWGFIVGGAGVAIALGGVITGVLSMDPKNLLEAECDLDGVCPDTQELRNAQSGGATLSLITDILIPVGGAAVVAGVILLFVLPADSEDSATAGFSCTSDGCMGTVQGRF